MKREKPKKTRSLETFVPISKPVIDAVTQNGNLEEEKIEMIFYEAVRRNDINKIMELGNKVLEINWQNPSDNLKTSLHVAIERNEPILVAYLLGRGAKVHLRDGNGHTALKLAVDQNNRDILDLVAHRTTLALEEALDACQIQSRATPGVNSEVIGSTRSSLFVSHFARQSLISEMLQISHFQTIYNIFVAIFCIAFTNTLLGNYMDKGVIIEFDLLLWCFGQATNAALVWLCLFGATFIAYFLQRGIVRGSISTRVAFVIHGILIASMYVMLPWYVVGVRRYPPATAFAISAEMVRLTMKMHSYLMVNMQLRKAKERRVEEESVREYPNNVTFFNFWMFLWFPTLVYQPKYPRTKSIRYSFVIKRFGDCFLCIIFIYAIFVRYCIPHFKEFHGNFTDLGMGIFHVMVPGISVNLLGFYGFLHSWLNAFAELTRFADRHFYSDWWNATGWGTYYRKWNTVVHNFLHRHLFLDAMESYGKGRNFALWLTFIISAIVHEYIIAIGLGFYKPILLIMFVVPGVLFIYLTKILKGNRMWNIFMWAMLIVGHGMLVGLYSRAWYFHYYQPPQEFNILNYIWIV